MPQDFAGDLRRAVEAARPRLEKISEQHASEKPSPAAWSRKEELGHLIDSATNNHNRFVRATLEPYTGPSYDGEGWVRVHNYADLPWSALTGFWSHYNHFLVGLLAVIPEDRLDNPCIIADEQSGTLRSVIEGYLDHMHHHLDHILAP